MHILSTLVSMVPRSHTHGQACNVCERRACASALYDPGPRMSDCVKLKQGGPARNGCTSGLSAQMIAWVSECAP